MPPPPGYWPGIEALCRKYDILLVSDEVINGFGRVGSAFGCVHYGFNPDIMVVSKQLTSSYVPLAALLFSDSIYAAVADNTARIGTFGHGFTTSGHPLAMAIALENLRIIEERDLMGNAARVGAFMQRELAKLASHPLVGEVRGSGLIAGVELVEDKDARRPFDPQLKAGSEGICARSPARPHRAGDRRHHRSLPTDDHYRGTGAGNARAAQNDARSGCRTAHCRWADAEEVRVMHTELLIGNKLEAGQGPAEAVLNPRTSQTLATVADATPGQVDAAVNAATKAFEKWSLTTPVERAGYMFKIADLIEREADAFAELESLNTGKPKHLMLRDEIPAIADCFRFFGGAVRCMHGPVAAEYLAGHTSMIRARSARRHRLDRAVELSADDGARGKLRPPSPPATPWC